ncbi:hypothetical protein Tco_0976938 [Tanacetum coccineum]|uniref:Uncharacterized protein n=1 Tax=Tanacetum coccineum TaxID=301880 RepID=A0ABQ5EIN4_9ASTR
MFRPKRYESARIVPVGKPLLQVSSMRGRYLQQRFPERFPHKDDTCTKGSASSNQGCRRSNPTSGIKSQVRRVLWLSRIDQEGFLGDSLVLEGEDSFSVWTTKFSDNKKEEQLLSIKKGFLFLGRQGSGCFYHCFSLSKVER